MHLINISLALSISCLTACVSNEKSNTDQPLGADRDTHGCIRSAGYSWCSTTERCERPWELAKKQTFVNTTENFEKYCQNLAP